MKVVVVAQAVKGAEMKQWPRVRVHGTEIGTPGTALAPVTKIGFAGVQEKSVKVIRHISDVRSLKLASQNPNLVVIFFTVQYGCSGY